MKEGLPGQSLRGYPSRRPPAAGSSDEDFFRGEIAEPDGEEACNAVSNHEARDASHKLHADSPLRRSSLMPRVMNVVPPRGGRILLAMLPFFLIAIIYVIGSAERRAANPERQAAAAGLRRWSRPSKRLAAEPDRRSGEYVLWVDTAASLRRLALGLGISAPGRARARPDRSVCCRSPAPASARWSRCSR